MTKNVILHIPHSSQHVPPEERQAICVDDMALRHELLRMTDAYTDELFPVTPVEAGRVVFPVSRLVCDVERFTSDKHEPMAIRGMGAIYTRTSTGEVLRAEPTAAERHSLLDRRYWPHHRTLEGLVSGVLTRSGSCLILDCHSFPSKPRPCDLDQNRDRPDMCIGTDDFHTPGRVVEETVKRLSAEGFSVAINRPFSGALVPIRHFRKNRRVTSLMIEVNRATYMDEATGERAEQFRRVKNAPANTLCILGQVGSCS
jgi:N-formylglutamate deformylase